MTLLLWIVRVLVLLLIIRFVVTMVRRAMAQAGGGTAPKGGPRTRQPERLGGTLVQDPHCGTYLPQDRAITVVTGDRTTHFCSPKCRDEWARRAS